MAIIIPEISIKRELDILIKKVYNDYKTLEQAGNVSAPSDVNAGVGVSVVTAGSNGTAQVISMSAGNGSTINEGILSNNYVLFHTPTKSFYIYFDKIDNSSNVVDPNIFPHEGIKVSILSTDSSTQVATKMEDILNNVEYQSYFTVVRSGDTLTVTNVESDGLKDSILYRMFGDLSFDGLNYFKTIASIVKASFESEKRGLNIYLGYNANRESFPMINILLPDEQEEPKNVGKIQGVYNYSDGSYHDRHENNYSVSYSLMISSDNENEVIVLYHFIKTLIQMGYHQFTIGCGFKNLYVSGRDIMLDFDIAPMNLFHRTLAMSFFYTNDVPDIQGTDLATGFNFNGTINGAIQS